MEFWRAFSNEGDPKGRSTDEQVSHDFAIARLTLSSSDDEHMESYRLSVSLVYTSSMRHAGGLYVYHAYMRRRLGSKRRRRKSNKDKKLKLRFLSLLKVSWILPKG